MVMCNLCEKQSKKVSSGRPHDYLVEIDEPRLFKGAAPYKYKEQDYLCLTCNSKFSHSTNKNDVAWTLWRG